MDSSPFIEKPKAREAPADPAGNADSLKTQINFLGFEVKDLRSKLELQELESEAKILELERQVKAQQHQIESLTSDNVFVHSQNQELQSKLQHVGENFGVERGQLEQQVASLNHKLSSLSKQNDELLNENKFKISKLEQDLQAQELNVANLREIKSQLLRQLEARDGEVSALSSLVDRKSDEISALQLRLSGIPSQEEIDSVETIKSQLSDQMSYIKDLESKNLHQAEKLKALSLKHDNIMILKEEKLQLEKKLKKVDELNSVINELNLEILNYKQEQSKWKVYLSEGDAVQEGQHDSQVKIEEFVKKYRNQSNENLILKNNMNKFQSELKTTKNEYNELFIKHEKLAEEFDSLSKSFNNLQKINNELEEQKKLIIEESNLLRNELNSLDNDKNDYIKNLENLIDEYKTKLKQQQQKNEEKSSSSDDHNNNKRMKYDETATRNFQSNISRLEAENMNLNNKNLKLIAENSILIKKIESIQDIKQKKIRILELRDNPFRNQQFINKKMLDALKLENTELLSTLKKNTDFQTIPKSVYDRILLDNEELESKIAQLNKKISRLREIFQLKSSEFIDAVYSLLGYKLIFLPSNKIKLIPKFVNNKENCIVIDVENQTLKTIKTNVNDDLEFFNSADNLVTFWLKEKNDIPCYLSALNLELFEKAQTV